MSVPQRSFTNFGKYVVGRVIDKDISYEKLSKALGLTSNHIRAILRGRYSHEKPMKRILEALDGVGEFQGVDLSKDKKIRPDMKDAVKRIILSNTPKGDIAEYLGITKSHFSQIFHSKKVSPYHQKIYEYLDSHNI